MKISDKAKRVYLWLRFEHCGPASHADIKAGTGIDLSTDHTVLREGNVMGIFVWSNYFKGFI